MSEAGAPEPSTEPPVTAAAEVAAQNSRDTGSSEGLRTMTDETTPVMRASEKTSTEEEEDDDKSSSVLLPQEAAQVEQSKGGDKGKNPESNTTEFDSSGLDNMSPLTWFLFFCLSFLWLLRPGPGQGELIRTRRFRVRIFVRLDAESGSGAG